MTCVILRCESARRMCGDDKSEELCVSAAVRHVQACGARGSASLARATLTCPFDCDGACRSTP
jgi:hypothetical protein